MFFYGFVLVDSCGTMCKIWHYLTGSGPLVDVGMWDPNQFKTTWIFDACALKGFCGGSC